MDEKHRKIWIKNTQTSIVRKNTWIKTKLCWLKKPTVREKMKILQI